jgi:hypothetical protein
VSKSTRRNHALEPVAQERVELSDATGNTTDELGRSVGRRGALRLGGMAAAGAASAVVARAMSAAPAAADSGDNLVIGVATNDAGSDPTALTASVEGGDDLTLSEPTLTVTNTAFNGVALHAAGGDNTAAGIVGTAGASGAGVYGISPVSGVGVMGECTDDGFSAVGAQGTGTGVESIVHGGPAVKAETLEATGPAVHARSGAVGQPAVQAHGTFAGNGIALDVRGKAKFNRSGLLTFSAGQVTKNTAAVTGGLSGARVLAMLQTNTAANVAVKSATPNANGTVTIRLTVAAPASLSVAWFVFG